MTDFQKSRISGTRFEQQLFDIITRYTSDIWRNIRIETVLTTSGTTEIDILFCLKDTVVIVEAKNVSSIAGSYGDKKWSFVGSTQQSSNSKSYSSGNVIVQNNIHVRSFKDLFFVHFKEWPKVVPIIAVPNNCTVSSDIREAIHTLSELNDYLLELYRSNVTSRVSRKVAALIPGDGQVVVRPDFQLDSATGKRIKKV